MTLEKCVIKELSDCQACGENRVRLRDRRGVEFPVLREWKHRNVVYNSLPTSMTDREDALRRADVQARHYLFTTESAREGDAVIYADRNRQPVSGQVRRI